MALMTSIVRDIEFVGSLTLPAYARISSISCTQEWSTVTVSWHHMAKDGPVIDTRGYRFAADHNGAPIFLQAYTHLKSLPEFAGATDC